MGSIAIRSAAGDLSEAERKELRGNMDKRFGATSQAGGRNMQGWGAAFGPAGNRVPGGEQMRAAYAEEAAAIRRRRSPSLIAEPAQSMGTGRAGYGGRGVFG